MMRIADKRHVQEITDRKADADTFRGQQEKKWIRLYKLQRSHLEKTSHPWRSNIFPPAPHYVIETYTPYIVQELFGRRPWVQPLPRGRKDIENTKNVEILLDYQLFREKALRKFVCWVKEAAVYGVGIRGLRWNWDMGQPEMIEIDIADFWKDPATTNIDGSEFCIRRYRRTKKQLQAAKNRKTRDPLYKNLGMLPDEGGMVSKDNVTFQREAVAEINTGEKGHEIWDCWTDYGKTFSVIADGTTLIRGPIDKPFKHGKMPFHKLGCIPIQHEFYDMGLLEPCEGLFYEKAHIRNQRMDARNICMNPVFEVYRGARIKQHQKITRPGTWIMSDSPTGGINPVKFDWSMFAASQAEEGNIDAEILNGSGALPQIAGGESQRRETATAHLEMKSSALMRVALINILSEETLEHFFEQYMQLNHQFLNKNVMIRLTDPQDIMEAIKKTKFLDIDPEMIKGNYDYRFFSSALRPREVDRKQFLELLSTLGQTGILQAILDGSIAENEAGKKLLEEIIDRFDFKNKSIFLEEASEGEIPVELEGIGNMPQPGEPGEGLTGGPMPEEMDILRETQR